MRNCMSLEIVHGVFSKLRVPTGIPKDNRAHVLHVRISKYLRGVVNKLPTLGVP